MSHCGDWEIACLMTAGRYYPQMVWLLRRCDFALWLHNCWVISRTFANSCHRITIDSHMRYCRTVHSLSFHYCSLIDTVSPFVSPYSLYHSACHARHSALCCCVVVAMAGYFQILYCRRLAIMLLSPLTTTRFHSRLITSAPTVKL